MGTNSGLAGFPVSGTKRRLTIRFIAAALSSVIAGMYFLIGFRLVAVLERTADQTVFGIAAGLAYMLGALLLLRLDHRALWLLGAMFQVFVILMYFNVAPQRTPAYEIWGILIRIVQVLLLGALVYLVVRPTHAPQGADQRERPPSAAMKR